MAFQVSPGVQVKEIDATNVIPAVSTSIGGFAGSFNWGPVDQIVTVGSESELAEQFGTPDDNTAKYFLTAAAFLKYGNALKVVRVASGHDNATADGTGQLIKNETDYDNNVKDNQQLRIFRNRGSQTFGGSLYEFLSVKGLPGTGGTDMTYIEQAEGYVAHKWDAASVLPVSHPYKSSAP